LDPHGRPTRALPAAGSVVGIPFDPPLDGDNGHIRQPDEDGAVLAELIWSFWLNGTVSPAPSVVPLRARLGTAGLMASRGGAVRVVHPRRRQGVGASDRGPLR